MPTFVLTDVSSDVWQETFAVDPTAIGLAEEPPWRVTKQRLRGGRRDGVDLVVVDNGVLRFSIVPTRGMGLWNGSCGGDRLGWDSPVTDGPIHPGLVNLAANGGLGWLDGFDELLARCGLENNGAPYEERRAGGGPAVTHGLHGRIANIPASYVAVHIDPKPPHEIVVEGRVDETRLFGMGVRMETRIATTPGSNRLEVCDEFVNLKDHPVEMQILYHWNFGPPFLGEGARLVAPARAVVPRDGIAQAALAEHDVYRPPTPGFREEVYFQELIADPTSGETLAMLKSPEGDKAVVLRYRLDELPAFTLWKNTGGLRDGYVTGLEPGVNYPNPRPFEKERGRVAALPSGARRRARMTLDILATAEQVTRVEKETDRLQSLSKRVVHPGPIEPFAAPL